MKILIRVEKQLRHHLKSNIQAITMIQFLMMLFGLVFPNDHTNAINMAPTEEVAQNNISSEDTSGETTQFPPRK